MKMKIHTHIQNGNPVQNRGKLFEVFAKFEGKNVTITVERRKDKRSNNANAYYHGVVVKMIKMAIEEQTGEVVTPGDVHEMLKGMFNFKPIYSFDCEITDETPGQRIPQSTANLSTHAFAKYVERCRFWGNDFFNIEIPEPNEDIGEHIDEDFK